jgi:hypothetical protein
MKLQKITWHNPLPPSTHATLQTAGLSLLTLAVTGVGQALTDVAKEHLKDRLGVKPHAETAAPPVAWVRPEDLPVFIYGLVDPRSSLVRYVGASVRPTQRREDHIREARGPSQTAKAQWLRELDANGLAPFMHILARTTKADWRAVEDALIKQYPNLTNAGSEVPEL